MAGNPISRRNVLPGLAMGATAALTAGVSLDGAPVEAAAARGRFGATVGPCNLWAGHTMSYQFFLPAVRGVGNDARQFRLVLKSLDGTVLVTHDFQLRPGAGVEVTLAVLEDGTLVFNGQQMGDVRAQLVVIAIIAILIGLLLPAVQKVRASATSFVPGRAPGEQNVDYLLPFVEQDNVVA